MTAPAPLPGLPPAGQTRRFAVASGAGAVGRCREQVRTALHEWGWLRSPDPRQQAQAEDIVLVVSELATNACQHAGGVELLVLSATSSVLRIEVLDRADTLPRPRLPHSPSRPGGHGLRAIALLASRWGHAPRAGAPGKSVWAEFDLPGR
ncbi:ATP-binding protein [Streptomyces tateyamensis]|uniref:ATP-binding protein n=2 Tax=Streptomyces tateyamensis TaxID=565073 RepID=A0A2V4MXA3_9ACTN|nr:ATP-binding protein [Streptomyces tateyamensis]